MGDGWDYINAVARGEDPDKVVREKDENHARAKKYDSKLGNFGIIYRSLFEYGLSTKAIAIYSALSIFADEYGRCFPGRSLLMKMTNIKSANTFAAAIEELQSTGFLNIEQKHTGDGRFTSNVYTLTPLPTPEDKQP